MGENQLCSEESMIICLSRIMSINSMDAGWYFLQFLLFSLLSAVHHFLVLFPFSPFVCLFVCFS